jgi:hypothetical protein
MTVACTAITTAAPINVVSAPTHDEAWWAAETTRDFLTTTELPADVGCIMTNLSFKLINKFIDHALDLCPNVIMLARLALLESERRSPVLDGAGLRRIFVFRKRLPMMHRHGWDGRKANSGMVFSWFVCERGYRGHPMTQRISWEDGRDAASLLLPHGRPTKGSRAGSPIKRRANRAYVLARLRRDGRADLIEMVESGALSVRRALAGVADKHTSGQ